MVDAPTFFMYMEVLAERKHHVILDGAMKLQLVISTATIKQSGVSAEHILEEPTSAQRTQRTAGVAIPAYVLLITVNLITLNKHRVENIDCVLKQANSFL